MIQKRGRRYRVQVKHRGIVVADRSFERRSDALVWEREQKQLILMGDFVPPSAGRVTVAQLAKTYLEARRDQVSVRAWESDESALVYAALTASSIQAGVIIASLQHRRLRALACDLFNSVQCGRYVLVG